MRRTHYDLVVLGAGSGNTIIDDRFGGWSVALVEEGPFGGTCLNRGCIPSKMLVATADVALSASHGPGFGVHSSLGAVDWPAVRSRIFGRTDAQAEAGREGRHDEAGVDVHLGAARFTGPRALEVDLSSGGTVEITADQVVIATGSRPTVPEIPGLHDVEHHTSDTIMRIEALPARLAVIGGGYVGAEFAHVFSSLGVEVVQVDAAEALIPEHDADVATLFTRLASKRWEVRLGTGLEKVEPTADGAALLHLDDGSSFESDIVLVAVGRIPNNDRLRVGDAGVEIDADSGLIVVDDHLRTSAEGVWALGDAACGVPLKHVANRDAAVVAHNLIHPDDPRVSLHANVPSAVFTSPQIASVGLTEAQAREQRIDLAVATQDYADTAHGWALLEDGTGHFVKLLADRATGRLVGAHLIGPQASILVQPLVQAMSFDQPVAGLAAGQFWIHPALTEVVEQALLDLEAALASD